MNHKQSVYPELGMLKERLANLSYLWRNATEVPPPTVLQEAHRIVQHMRINLANIEGHIMILKQVSR